MEKSPVTGGQTRMMNSRLSFLSLSPCTHISGPCSFRPGPSPSDVPFSKKGKRSGRGATLMWDLALFLFFGSLLIIIYACDVILCPTVPSIGERNNADLRSKRMIGWVCVHKCIHLSMPKYGRVTERERRRACVCMCASYPVLMLRQPGSCYELGEITLSLEEM